MASSFFNYSFASHFYRPSTILTNTEYPVGSGIFSQVASPFNGDTLNLISYNLAAFANDATIRLGIIEASSQLGYSTTPGYVAYTARQETEGAFYSGVPLVINPSTSLLTAPYTFATPLAFQASASNGIVLQPNGTVDAVNSKFVSFVYGTTGQTGPYATPQALTTYLNSKLVFNTLTQTNVFGFPGTANPYSVGSATWNSTWGNLTAVPKSFWIYVNDGKILNSGILVTLSQSILYSSSISTLATLVNAAVQGAIGATAPAVTVAPDVSSTYINLTQSTNDRSAGGAYQIRVERVSGDTNSPLDWLGWTTSTSSNSTETYDYSSLFTFVASSTTSPFGISIQGTGPYSTLTFKPQDNTGTVIDLLSALALPTTPNLYYHTRLPLTSYNNRPLNYGGSLTINNLVVNGSITYAGTATYTGTLQASSLGFIASTYNPLLQAVFYPGNVVPSYVQTVRGNWNGPFSANSLIVPSSNPVEIGYASLVGDAYGATTYNLAVPAMPTNGTIVAQFATQQSGYFDRSASVPVSTHLTRLNYDGNLYVNNLFATTYGHFGVVEGRMIPGFLTNPAFDLDQTANILPTGWTFQKNTTPGAIPTPTAVAGTPNGGTTFRTNNISPLIGNWDGNFVKAAVNDQGVFASSQFTIDRGVAGQYHQVRFNYLASSNYVAGDIGVFLYDVTGNTVITPTISAVPVSGASTPAFFTTYFKTTVNTNNTTYKIILHNTSTNASAWGFQVGGVSVTDLTVGALPRAEYTISAGAFPASAGVVVFDTLVENVGGGVLSAGRWTPPLPGVYSVSFSGISTTALTAMTAGTTNVRFDLRKAATIVTPIAGRFFDLAASQIGPLSGTQTVRVVNPATDILDIIYTLTGPMTGTPVFSVTSGQQGRISIQWLGF